MKSHKQTLETYFALKTDVLINCVYKSYFTSLITNSMPIIKANLLVMYVEVIAVYCENHTKHINTMRRPNAASVP